MNVRHTSLLSMAILCGLTATSVAQERVRVESTRAPADSADAGYFKASDLIGMEVRGTENQDLGEVQDLFIDRRTHEVEYLILDTGVFADLDGKQPIIPWMIVDMHAGADADTHYLSVPLTQERIKSAPTVMLTDIDLTRSPAWVTQVDEFYSNELRERRVSRPDLDQNRDSAAPRSRERDSSDRSAPDRPRQTPNAPGAERNTPKPDPAPDTVNKPDTATAPKKPINP